MSKHISECKQCHTDFDNTGENSYHSLGFCSRGCYKDWEKEWGDEDVKRNEEVRDLSDEENLFS